VLAAARHASSHQVVFQINSEDPAPMRHAVSNAVNLARHYRDKHENLRIEIVAYGAGITMFRADTSPVREILEAIRKEFPEIAFTMCGSSKAIIEQREGRPLPLLDGTEVVPFGIVRLVERQEAGWSYIGP
jgi:intracellular sulfur oxidation DsrE/DsrF family protein